jgi:hypothetical protein
MNNRVHLHDFRLPAGKLIRNWLGVIAYCGPEGEGQTMSRVFQRWMMMMDSFLRFNLFVAIVSVTVS